MLNILPPAELLNLARTHWRPLALGAGLGYLLLVRALRWRVYNKLHERYAGRDWKHDLTVAEAQEICHASVVWDMRTLVSYALSFAIIRTYAIPTISKVLLGSKELSDGPQVSKRFLDTAIIVATWHACPISATAPPSEYYHVESASSAPKTAVDDPRTFVGIARMNWLHSHYKILNGDYLYTLSLFVLDPIEWARRWGWREMSPLEQHARFVFYKQIGEYMSIEGIPDTLEELIAWSEDYEKKYMVPAKTNADLANGMLNELASGLPLPGPLKNFVRGCIIVMFPERMRVAMMLPKPTFTQRTFVHTFLFISAFAQRHLMLPRFAPAEPVVPLREPAPGEPARMHPVWPVTKPWYVPEPRGFKLAIQNVLVGLGLKKADEVPGEKYLSQGFRMEELGPLRWTNVGHDKVFQDVERMVGCPVQGVWAKPGTANEKLGGK